MGAEQLWARALERSEQAAASGALVPLKTERIDAPELAPFVLRRLISRTPKHLRSGGPKPNPFLPWQSELEVARPSASHVLLLNKYPVQRGHVLLITSGWKPQSGWLEPLDWQALCRVNADTTGLWFFNSCGAAGASQPHRHLQLLPRRLGEPSCALEQQIERWLDGNAQTAGPAAGRPAWMQALSRRQDPADAAELEALYVSHCGQLGLGRPGSDPVPRAPYNLLLTDRWLLTVRRRKEHGHGFSINALGFAGYLLVTEASDLSWLQAAGGWRLLEDVAAPLP
ncbi:MAG: ATP adenylyltransferase [Cyanobacteriota bacterium]|nr:ATP adenylyltransferase [Cyanobacteriota bacterium]